MTIWLPRLFTCLMLLPVFQVVAAAPHDAEIARFVKQLGHDDFERREEATTRLKEIGEPALAALRKALASTDPEVRRRAEDSIDAIENKLYPEHRLTGHTEAVCCVAISADGKRLLTSSDDKTLRLWDADTGKCLRVFEGHTGPVWGAALSPDGKHVLSGSHDKTVRLWDATTGKVLRDMTGYTLAVAFGPEGKAISAGDGAMLLWNLSTGEQLCVFPGHTSVVDSIAYSGKSKLAATGSWDQSIRLWNLETGKEVRKLTGHTMGVMTVCFSPDGKHLLSAAPDNTLRLWDVATGKEVKRIAANSSAVQQAGTPSCAAFSPDGARIVSGSADDHFVRVWDVATGKELRKYDGHTSDIRSVTFFPDGKRIAFASGDGTVRIWRAPR